MWYLIHQQAKDIIAAREREAAQLRLEREALRYRSSRSVSGQPGIFRRRSASLAAALSRSSARLATALDPRSLDGGSVEPGR